MKIGLKKLKSKEKANTSKYYFISKGIIDYIHPVIPAKAGIQLLRYLLDTRLRGYDVPLNSFKYIV
jgi:hypothetical protein